MHNYFLK